MKPSKQGSYDVAGYTLIELLVVIAMVGILAAIAGPSWLAFVSRQRLSGAQDEVLRAVRAAQSNALRDKQSWCVMFQNGTSTITDEVVGQYAVRKASVSADGLLTTCAAPATPWKDLPKQTRFATGQGGVIAFNFLGVVPTVGQTPGPPAGIIAVNTPITLVEAQDLIKSRRCIAVTSLLGSINTYSEADGVNCPAP